MKKQRGDATLKNLPPKQQADLFALLQEHSYADVKIMIAKEPGIQTSVGALSAFYHWYPLSRRLEQAASFADQLKSDLLKLPDLNLDAEKLSQVGQVAFEARALHDQDAELYVALKKRRQKDAELALSESKHALALKLYEEKISAARESLQKAKSKGGISPETLQLIEEQLKLL